MTWLVKLLTDENSIATSILVLAATIVLGIAIGEVRIRGIKFGVAGVLFSGLLLGHFGLKLQHDAADFAREFGLVLFIYAVGMAVGPGFFNLFRAFGLKTNAIAVVVVVLGMIMAGISVRVGGVAPPIAVGVLAGATTNTPSLAAATQTLKDRPPDDAAARASLRQIGVDAADWEPEALRNEVEKLPGLGYAVSYPAGVVGIILSFVILRWLFGVDPVEDARRMEREVIPPQPPLERWSIRVTRAELASKSTDQVLALSDTNTVISRIRRGESVQIALGATPIAVGDVLLVVGTAAELERFSRFAGEAADIAEWGTSHEIVARWVVVSQRNLVGRKVEDAQLSQRLQVRLTRIRRGETELLPTDKLRLAFGDELFVVGGEEEIAAVAHEAGDVAREVEEPHLLPMFFGIGLGVIVGSIPFVIPGLAAPLKIGLAGGPLLIALVLSHVRRLGRLVFYLPRPANTALKELGIAVFLAVVGLKSGGRFMETLTQGDGVWWLAWGIGITLVPMLVVGIVMIAGFRTSYTATVGILAGSMTDPPALAFANSLTKSEGSSLAYATVYPTAMILRVVGAQVFLIASG